MIPSVSVARDQYRALTLSVSVTPVSSTHRMTPTVSIARDQDISSCIMYAFDSWGWYTQRQYRARRSLTEVQYRTWHRMLLTVHLLATYAPSVPDICSTAYKAHRLVWGRRYVSTGQGRSARPCQYRTSHTLCLYQYRTCPSVCLDQYRRWHSVCLCQYRTWPRSGIGWYGADPSVEKVRLRRALLRPAHRQQQLRPPPKKKAKNRRRVLMRMRAAEMAGVCVMRRMVR
eukprot:196628-Rhodomonas_salina.2